MNIFYKLGKIVTSIRYRFRKYQITDTQHNGKRRFSVLFSKSKRFSVFRRTRNIFVQINSQMLISFFVKDIVAHPTDIYMYLWPTLPLELGPSFETNLPHTCMHVHVGMSPQISHIHKFLQQNLPRCTKYSQILFLIAIG